MSETRLLALVFTDVVGSTAARQSLGDRAYADAIQAHHGVLRAALAEVGDGEEIETAGDSMLLTFGTPSAAVRFALRSRSGLRSWNAGRQVPLRDRYAVHLGEVVVREGARKELFSLALDTCARLQSLAEAERILLTRSVFDNARRHVEGVGLTWWNHGLYTLAGVDTPLEVFEVAEESDGPRSAPANAAKAKRVAEAEQEEVTGWRPSSGQAVPGTSYVLVRSLGEGSVGEVWLAKHKMFREQKVFKFCFGTERLRSLRREVAIFRVLQERVGSHPHIVSVQDVRLDEPPCWLMSDYTEGVDVVSWWEAQAAPPARGERLELIAQVAEALQAAHEAGVLHRDVKPANVLVEVRAGRLHARLTDFGIGQVTSSELLAGLTVEGLPGTMVAGATSTYSGTRMYMAPELVSGQAASPRSDVYALGVMLWQLLVGDLRRAPPMDWARWVDDGLLVEDLRRCFAGDPGERWQGAAELGRSLRTLEARRAERSAREAEAAQRAVEEAVRLDQERRRAAALEAVAQAVALSAAQDPLRARAAALRAEAALLLAEVKPWEPEERKAPGWAKEAETAELERQIEELDLEAGQRLAGALQIDPATPEAHAALAERYGAAHLAAEEQRDGRRASRVAVLLRVHAERALPAVSARWGAYLKGDGALTLVTDVPGAEVLLHRYEVRNRRMVAVPVRNLGRTPLLGVPLPMGSYLCVLRHPERAEVRYPVSIGRGEHWDGVRPGAAAPHRVRLPLPDELGPDDCLVPPGWFWSGGDAEAVDSLPRRRLWCDELVVKRFPVTNREYLVFLDDLVAQGREQEALRHAPRERAAMGEGSLVYGRDGAGRFVLRPDADGDVWDLDWPVLLVDWFAASAYAAWLGDRTGRPWRLPGQLEWEKAARGADGRFYPWGDAFDPSWCCLQASHSGRALPQVVDSFPQDESVYGVRGLGGNVQDWCADVFRPEGPIGQGDTIVSPAQHTVDSDTTSARVQHGGLWLGAARSARAAHRHRNEPGNRSESLGFRVVFRPGPQHG